MKKILQFFLILISSLILTTSVHAEEIKNFDAEISLNSDGTINVVEKILYDFGSLERHGIFRNIPYIKTNKDGKKFRMELENFSVVDEKNFPYRFQKSVSDGKVSVKIGDPDKTITGNRVYKISYKVSGALTYFSDHDELYWNITGNRWEIPINSSSAEITLTREIQKKDIRVSCYTGSSGSTSSDCYLVDDRPQDIIVKSKRVLTAGEGLTIVVGFPIDMVARLEPKEYIEFSETWLGKLIISTITIVAVILAVFWYAILPFIIIYKWYKTGRDPKGTTGVVRSWYDPPKIAKGNRYLTPGEVGALGDETVDLKDISATIVDLARRGYLKIEERKKGDFWLIRHPELVSGSVNKMPKRVRHDMLVPYERLLIDKFFKGEKEIRLKTEHLYSEVEEVKKGLYEQTVTDGLFPKNPQNVRISYAILVAGALFTANFPLALTSFVFGRVMPRKTLEGVNAFNESKSLRNFLTSQERQLKFQADKQLMFEKLLPYAVAFGVEKIWAKRFESMNLRQPNWYSGYSSGHFNSYLFVSSLNSSMKSFRSAATPTSSSSGFSSGFSGGSSGGGGGGGGGGSW